MKRLAGYRKKRKAQETNEPMNNGYASDGTLRFVVQKHRASHLHYDLRLELDGILKSWAIPKGFPFLEGEKRIAILVEDHPFSYKDFEGEIPKGNYGAGKMEVWDEGNYLTLDAKSLKDAQTQFQAGLKKGHVAIVLNGKKLSGVFHLVRTETKGQPSTWLLFKKATAKKIPDKMPQSIAPMLASSVEKPFNKKDWIFEIKWDGYRALAKIEKGKRELISRNQKSFNRKFPLIYDELEKLSKHEMILDGEVVALDEAGHPSFSLLQSSAQIRDENLYYYVFDILFLDGYDLRARPLWERKERLEILLTPFKKSRIRFSDHVEAQGISLFEEAKKLQLEGIIAKNAQSTYQEIRSKNWLKIRASKRQEFVIGGYTEPKNSRDFFGSLMIGYFDGGELIYSGLVGTGFDDQTLKELFAKFQRLVRKRSPFSKHTKVARKTTYLKPALVCEVSFTEWTADGCLRHPVFLGLRDDKEAKDVKADTPR